MVLKIKGDACIDGSLDVGTGKETIHATITTADLSTADGKAITITVNIEGNATHATKELPKKGAEKDK